MPFYITGQKRKEINAIIFITIIGALLGANLVNGACLSYQTLVNKVCICDDAKCGSLVCSSLDKNGVCVQCRSTNEKNCVQSNGEKCYPGLNVCVCQDSNCGPNKICKDQSSFNSTCVQCRTSSDCKNSQYGTACINNDCVCNSCLCNPGITCTVQGTNGFCGPCQTNSDCYASGDDKAFCQNSVCKTYKKVNQQLDFAPFVPPYLSVYQLESGSTNILLKTATSPPYLNIYTLNSIPKDGNNYYYQFVPTYIGTNTIANILVESSYAYLSVYPFNLTAFVIDGQRGKLYYNKTVASPSVMTFGVGDEITVRLNFGDSKMYYDKNGVNGIQLAMPSWVQTQNIYVGYFMYFLGSAITVK